MSEEHQIATDDEQRDDLSSPVTASRELAMLRAAFAIVRDESVAAMTAAFDATTGHKKRHNMKWSYRLQEAAGVIDQIIRIKEQAVVSRDGHG